MINTSYTLTLEQETKVINILCSFLESNTPMDILSTEVPLTNNLFVKFQVIHRYRRENIFHSDVEIRNNMLKLHRKINDEGDNEFISYLDIQNDVNKAKFALSIAKYEENYNILRESIINSLNEIII